MPAEVTEQITGKESVRAVAPPTPRPVLVVDDDPEIRESLAVMLGEEGYPVRTAIDGRDALHLLERIETPGLIVLDLTMPVMDGNTLLAVLDNHPRFGAIPTVILSAVAHRAQPGALRVLAKPVEFEDVLQLVREYCGPAGTAV